MTLLALLLATLALKTLPELRGLHSTGWMQAWEDALAQWLPPVLVPPRPAGLLLWLLPVGLAVAWLDHWLANRSLLAALLFEILLLVHVLRLPVIEDRDTPESQASTASAFAVEEQELLEQVQGWFGPALWFALLGPAGAVLYRMLNQQPETDTGQPVQQCSHQLRLRWLVNFPVAQLMGLGLAVVDNFAPIFHQWKNQQCPETGSRFDLRCRFLGQVLRMAVDDGIRTAQKLGQTQLEAEDPHSRRWMVQKLMQRVQWLWLTVLALLSLGGLLA